MSVHRHGRVQRATRKRRRKPSVVSSKRDDNFFSLVRYICTGSLATLLSRLRHHAGASQIYATSSSSRMRRRNREDDRLMPENVVFRTHAGAACAERAASRLRHSTARSTVTRSARQARSAAGTSAPRGSAAHCRASAPALGGYEGACGRWRATRRGGVAISSLACVNDALRLQTQRLHDVNAPLRRVLTPSCCPRAPQRHIVSVRARIAAHVSQTALRRVPAAALASCRPPLCSPLAHAELHTAR
jgi:hypothetical protein